MVELTAQLGHQSLGSILLSDLTPHEVNVVCLDHHVYGLSPHQAMKSTLPFIRLTSTKMDIVQLIGTQAHAQSAHQLGQTEQLIATAANTMRDVKALLIVCVVEKHWRAKRSSKRSAKTRDREPSERLMSDDERKE